MPLRFGRVPERLFFHKSNTFRLDRCEIVAGITPFKLFHFSDKLVNFTKLITLTGIEPCMLFMDKSNNSR